MKCKECKAEMTEWQRSKDGESVIVRYRCDTCGWETADILSREKPREYKPPKEE